MSSIKNIIGNPIGKLTAIITLACALSLCVVGSAPAAESALSFVTDSSLSVPVSKAYAATPKLSAKKKTIAAGKSVTLKVKNAGKSKIVWKSSNKKIATVSKKGKVTAKKAGTAVISAKVGKKTLKCKITVKIALNKTSIELYKGKSITLKVKGTSSKTKWKSSAPSIATVNAKGKVTAKKIGKTTITAEIGKKTLKCKVSVVKPPATPNSDAPTAAGPNTGSNGASDSTYQIPSTSDEKALVNKVAGYTYKIIPVNGALNNMVFVETNNPDPMSFQFSDESSKYLGSGETALYKPLCRTYVDVQYSNKDTRRISNRGYLFYNYESNSDGGALKILANRGYYYQSTSWGAMYNDGVNYDTGKTVTVQPLEDDVDYLLRTYASGKTGFFDKMSAVQYGLNQIALYPKPVLDTSRPRENAYPALATSPYPELSLNDHIENMFERAEDGVFLSAAYGFVLDSLGVPGMMNMVAKRIDSSCTVTSGYTHAYIDVTYKGETRSYGGAGAGGSDPLYSKFIDWKFKFDGTDQGYGTNLSMEVLRKARTACTTKSNALADAYNAQVGDKALTNIMGDGTWIRAAAEGSSMKSLCYVLPGPDGSSDIASDMWVDGRYINKNERYVPGAKFSEHNKSTIVVKNVTYKKSNGQEVTGTVAYNYQSDTCDWRAPWYYAGGWSYVISDCAELHNLSPNLVLSQDQIDKMAANGEIDGKTNVEPDYGYIFDGSVVPGTYGKL